MMKSRVKYSGYVIVLTFVATVALSVGTTIYLGREQYPGGILMLTFLLILVALGCLYGPMSIQMDPEYVRVRCPFRTFKIRMDEIESVELFQPTAGAMRICASGGYMGYWGLYREGDVGNYIAFYGKSSDCFMVRLKNGDKYVLGCGNPQLAVAYINSKNNSN